MATAEQIKALIRSHMSGDPDQFHTTALQIAAHEARSGHTDLAQEIRSLVLTRKQTSVVVKLPDQLDGLIISNQVDIPLQSLVLSDPTKGKIQRIILEYRQQNKLKHHGLSHRRKLLLSGPPGTGKTMTAKVLASELSQPLHIVQMDLLIAKFMGETSARLRQVFDRIREISGVYLFDEFDAIGGERSLENDVGEMRRVLTTFLQFIEVDTSDNLIIAATNNLNLLDRALFRRFDDVIHYSLPSEKERQRLFLNLLGGFYDKGHSLDEVTKAADGLSHADITRACQDAVKSAILADQKLVTHESLLTHVKERHMAYRN